MQRKLDKFSTLFFELNWEKVNLKITDKETARLLKHNKTIKTTQAKVHTLFVYLTTLHVMSQQAELSGKDSEGKLIVLQLYCITRYKRTWRGGGAHYRRGRG